MQYLITLEQTGCTVSVKTTRMLTTSELNALAATGDAQPTALSALVDFLMKAADVWLATQQMTPAQRAAYVDQSTVNNNNLN